jgi:hypothetical protein
MTLPLPSLDDRTFDDLVEEARSLIRTHQPEWTNHNPSDPGITLIELFAWLAEMLIYRCDQVPDRHHIVFLRLLNGPGWTPAANTSIEDEIAASVNTLRARFRAVTASDYEALTLEASPLVARALCLAKRDLGASGQEEWTKPRPGYVSVLVLPAPGTSVDEAATVRGEVHEYLEPRRLLTTRNVVAEPVWAPLSAEILVAPRPDVLPATAIEAVTAALKRFLDPWRGGTDGTGWPFGRDVHLSELYSVLESLPEVDYVPDIGLSSAFLPGDRRRVEASPVWGPQGDQIAVGLAPHVLPEARIEAAQIKASTEFVAITAVVTVELHEGDADRAEWARFARIRSQQRLREFFHPFHGGPTGKKKWSITSASIKTDLALKLSDAGTVGAVVLAGDPAYVSTDELGVITVTLGERELADLEVQVQVQEPVPASESA